MFNCFGGGNFFVPFFIWKKMSIPDKITGVIEGQLTKDQFLVDVVLKGTPGNQKLIVLVDSDNGMSINDCAAISRSASGYLEENEIFEDKYTLEVSSPGLDHPLKLKRQYQKNIGRGLKVKDVNGQLIEGKLKEVKEDKIFLELRDSKNNKKSEPQSIELPYSEIDSAMVVVSFNKKR